MTTCNVLPKIESIFPYLTSTETKIATYILNDPHDIIYKSTKALSKACCVSEPSLIRFARKLGFSGFKELKLCLSTELAVKDAQKVPVEVDLNDDGLSIYNKLASFAITSINNTAETLDQKSLDEAANIIYKTSKNHHSIFLSGLGASTIMVKEFQIKMMRLNIQTIFYEDIHLRLEACTNLEKGDLFICFTSLGVAAQNYEMIDIAKERGVKIILVTQFGNSKLSEKADICLYTSAVENNLRLASQTSIVVQSLIVNTLFLSIAIKEYPEISKDVKKTKEIFKNLGYNLNLQ